MTRTLFVASILLASFSTIASADDSPAEQQHFPKLRIYSPQQYKNQLPYENGWDHLLKVPTLQRLEIAGSRAGTNGSALESLKRARPQLEIESTLSRSRNYNGL